MNKTSRQDFHFLTSEAAIDRMNDLGKQQVPFLFIVDFEMRQSVVEALPLPDLPVLFNINGFTNISSGSRMQKKTFTFRKTPISYEIYKAAFDGVMNEILQGNSYLVNLTQPSFIDTDLSLEEIFYYSRARYRLWFNDQFVVFSPEIFVRIHNGMISSYPMKGTIDAAIPNAARIILNDEKEKAEHLTMVDLIRNDLSIFAKDVKVARLRYVDRLVTNSKDLLQVSSEITGRLPANYKDHIGHILFSLLPAGSVSGAPKPQTLEIIRSAEKYDRGFYTGVFGYFDGQNMDSGVMIRFIEKKAGELIYKSGGGITFQSDPKAEYQELINKIYVPFIRNIKS